MVRDIGTHIPVDFYAYYGGIIVHVTIDGVVSPTSQNDQSF
jgi:hypothetical protein